MLSLFRKHSSEGAELVGSGVGKQIIGINQDILLRVRTTTRSDFGIISKNLCLNGYGVKEASLERGC